MRQLSTKLFHPFTLLVVIVSLTTVAESASTTAVNRPEVKLSGQEVEKFLEGLARYLHGQRMAEQVHHQLSSEENYDPDDGVADTSANRNKMSSSGEERFGQETGSNYIAASRPSGGKWSLANSDQRDGLVKQRPTYGKRNSELINSLLGLPRFMKVVG